MKVLNNVKIIINWFQLCSRLKVNSHKSLLMNVDLEFTKGMVDALRCKSYGLPVKYLGHSLGENLRLENLTSYLILLYVVCEN